MHRGGMAGRDAAEESRVDLLSCASAGTVLTG